MSALSPPDAARLAALSDHFGFGLSAEEIDEFVPAVAGTLVASEAVERFYEGSAPAAPERPWAAPAPSRNRWGGWYVTTSINESPQGPLSGRTVAVKDNIAVAGVPMMNGSRSVDGFVPRRDATVVRRLLDAGATIAGKSVCEDLCFSGASFTSQPGPVRNPWDESRNAGGSSSGSAALVATGEADLALSGDQGGSIRIPSSFCGIVGHKPTHGLVPYTGAFPIERTIDHLGPMARTVADTVLMLTVLAGVDGMDPRQPSDLDAVEELIAHFARQRIERGAELSRTVKLVGLSGRYTFEVGGGKYYAMARQLVPELRAAYDAALSEHDVLVMPTLPYTATEIPPDDVSLPDYLATGLSMVGNTAPFDVTGHPACSVPAGLVNGLPAGLMIVGKKFDDATVLRVAHTYEQAVGGFPAPPVAATTGSNA